MRVCVVLLMMIDDDHMIIVSGFPLNINMSSNNFITLTGVYTSADVNNGIASTAIFSQSASNKGLITNQGTFAETTSNQGLATGVVVFQGTATNDGTVAEAVFLGSSRNVGTITTSATFANSSVNAGVVHGAAVLVDVAHNMGTIAGSVQLGASAVNTGTVYGNTTLHDQADGLFAYGYYATGIRTSPPDYETVAYQVGDFWYTYDVAGFASLANGEYDDGTTTIFVFVGGVKVAEGGGGLVEHSYAHSSYWADVATLSVGVVLYTGQFVSTRAANLSAVDFFTGYRVTTNSLGVITVYEAIYHAYTFCGVDYGCVYADVEELQLDIVLYSQQQNTNIVADISDVPLDGYLVTTNGIGIVTNLTINHPYSSIDGNYWTDTNTVVLSGKWYTGQNVNTIAANLVNEEAFGSLFDTDSLGRVTSISAINHTQCTVNYYGDTGSLVIVGSTILYIGANTMVTASNLNQEDTLDGNIVSTDATGLVTLYTAINHANAHGDYWSDDAVLALGSILYTGKYTMSPAAYLSSVTIGEYIVSTDAAGSITAYDPV